MPRGLVRIDLDTALFALMCLIWGATWVATKEGISAVPPVLFAGYRFIAAGLCLYGFLLLRGAPLRFRRGDWGRLLVVTLLMVSACYALLFWGMTFVNSGTAALIDLSLTPVALLTFAILHREERFNLPRALAIGLGVAGLAVLFAPKAMAGARHQGELVGGTAIIVSAALYAWGSVLARPLLRAYPPTLMAAATTLIGGVVLLIGSLALEPGARTAACGDWGVRAWLGWAFMVLGGSLAGYTIFMRLLKAWGPSRAGAYAFVSPAVAVPLGMAWYGERLGLADIIGTVMMLSAAFLAVRESGAGKSAQEPIPDGA
jgi:drug/metabolite transporter (DMT)-like permease